jgi:hypothetical protein
MDVSDAKKLRALENGNAEMKPLLTEPVMDNAKLKEMNKKTSNFCFEENRCGFVDQ